MTRTIITILMTFYAVLRLVTVGSFYYYDTMRLPTAAVVITVLCALLTLFIVGRCYLYRLTGKNLRFALFLGAMGAAVNMIIILLDQPGTLSNPELLITGTFFDVLIFLGSCTIKIRDTRGKTGRTPFSRVTSQEK